MRGAAAIAAAPRELPVLHPAVLKVAIADDHAVVRSGYRRLLELDDGIAVVAEFGDGESATQWLLSNAADVLILDLSMPGLGGLATLERLHKRLPGLRIMVFTMHEDASMAAQALRLGATGYVTKSSPPETLVDAVRELRAGGQPVVHGIADATRAHETMQAPHARLSPRELDIFLLLAEGISLDRIAEQRCLSGKTVANYQTRIRNKTGLGNALEMHRYARRHGLLAAPPLPA